ncbi:hypothetical protein ZIOFF_010469 [Zingiber officinale]|uniref:DDE Tnp4 domain-containing protein n=1 Tax=Zingiber officinale TaxID=94328 RepID=A0A8J5LK07_ZINOF|nr:hypothetical protein ZIOFF_010469 [Zingiber officinale]
MAVATDQSGAYPEWTISAKVAKAVKTLDCYRNLFISSRLKASRKKTRPTSLKVPQGCYYLVDTGYCNSSQFLAPYHGHSKDPQESIEDNEESEYGESDDDDETHKDAKRLYNVSFPYFTDLDIVYGKNRETGDVAEDPLAAEQNLGNADVTLLVTDESDSNIEIEFLSTMESMPSNSSNARSSKIIPSISS